MRLGAVIGLILVLLVLALPVAAQKGKKKKEKGAPDIQIVHLKIQRDGGNIILEGKMKNISEKPMKGMIVFFEFLEFNGKMISRMTTQVSEADLAPGEEGEFATQTPDQVRAVSVRLDAEDTKGQYLLFDKPGPYTID